METRLTRRELLKTGILGGAIFFLASLLFKDTPAKNNLTPNISQVEASYYRHLAG